MIIKETKTKILDSKPLTCFFIQTGFGTAFTYLTSGVFLSGNCREGASVYHLWQRLPW